MNRFKKLLPLLTLIAVMLVIPTGVFSYTYNQVFDNTPPNTLNWNCPLSSWYGVTSKWDQPRSVGTNPHQGIDLAAPYGTSTKAVWDGWVTSIGTYSISLKIDANSNGVQDDSTYYCYYYHLSAKKPNGYYAKGTEVASSGDEAGAYPAHLHFGGVSANSDWYRTEMNYRWTSYWNYGKDIDVFSNVQYGSNTAQITAYFKDEAGTYTPGEVRIFHRKTGTSAWTDGGLMTNTGNYVYTYNFTGKYAAGTSIQWMVRMQRAGLSVYSYCWAPAKFDQPDPNPNSTAYTYAYYSSTVN